MKQFKQTFILASLSALFLSGCGSSDGNGQTETDHDHDISVLVSQANTTALSLLEEDELEALDDAVAGNGSILVLSETGAFAAVRSDSTVSFVHGLHEEEEEGEEAHEEEHEEEAHVLEFSLTGTNVITSNGHFAVFNSGSTTFVEYDELENESPATETFDSIVQTYPALMLDEEHELVLAFDGTDALVYEGTTLEDSFTCATPTAHAQTHEVIALTCGTDVKVLVVEENAETGEHEFSSDTFTNDLAGTPANFIWRAMGEVVVGFEPNTAHYAIAELDEESGRVDLIASSDSDAFTFDANICDIKLDTEASDILVITAGGEFVALNHEGEELQSITLDESAQSTCGDFVMAPAAKTAIVVDNEAQMVFEIDVDDAQSNPNGYHVHGREELDVSDIASMVIFHEIEAGEHEH